MTTEIRGTIERVQFASDRGWCILGVRTDGGARITVRGTVVAATVGERIRCRGVWTQHPTYGRQFDAQVAQTAPPVTEDAIEKYLASGVIDGIGPQYARKLVKHFGVQLPEVLQHNPVYLESVDGIGPQRRRQIVDSWQKHANVRDIMMFLHQHGVGSLRAAQIHRRYGDRAIHTLRENPYRLAEELRGVGFMTADQIARRVGISGEHDKRIEAGLRAGMQRERANGHCAVLQTVLIHHTATLLAVSRESVSTGLERMIDGHRLVREDVSGAPAIFTPALYAAEVSIAANIRRLLRHAAPWGRLVNAEQRIHAAEQRSGLSLYPTQFEAVRSLIGHKVCVVTGGPGCGKTTITRLIVELLSEALPNIHLCSPTGKASRQLAKKTGREAMTLHRLLRGAPDSTVFGYDSRHPLDTQIVIVDESKMVEVELMASLLEALPDSAALFLVGDVDQLASVGPGQVLDDLIESGVVHVVRLTENRRHSENSSVVRNAHRVNRGLAPEAGGDPNDDFQWIIENDLSKVPDRLVQLVSRELPRQFNLDPMKDIQTLSPMRRGRNPLCTDMLNLRLQETLSPHPKEKLVVGGTHFGLGDRLVQLTNYTNRGVFNGDVGNLCRIKAADRTFDVDFEDLVVTYEFDEIDDLALANALSVHKAQGSEYPLVVIAFASSHYPLLSKRLLYTANTRGVRVRLIGDERAVHIALSEQRNEIRRTGLKERLRRAA